MIRKLLREKSRWIWTDLLVHCPLQIYIYHYFAKLEGHRNTHMQLKSQYYKTMMSSYKIDIYFSTGNTYSANTLVNTYENASTVHR